jgi:hypothetical protein
VENCGIERKENCSQPTTDPGRDHHAGILARQLDEISDQLKEDVGSRHGIAMIPQIPSGFGQNRGILFFAEDRC